MGPLSILLIYIYRIIPRQDRREYHSGEKVLINKGACWITAFYCGRSFPDTPLEKTSDFFGTFYAL